MNRKEFLKRIGIGVAAVAVVPSVFASVPKKEYNWDLKDPQPNYIYGCDPYKISPLDAKDIKWVRTEEGNCLWYSHAQVELEKEFLRKKELAIFGI